MSRQTRNSKSRVEDAIPTADTESETKVKPNATQKSATKAKTTATQKSATKAKPTATQKTATKAKPNANQESETEAKSTKDEMADDQNVDNNAGAQGPQQEQPAPGVVPPAIPGMDQAAFAALLQQMQLNMKQDMKAEIAEIQRKHDQERNELQRQRDQEMYKMQKKLDDERHAMQRRLDAEQNEKKELE